MDILTIAGLGKSFGNQRVLDDLSFSVPEGSIYGFIGKNGSGKTTTMKIVLGLLQSDAGEISICGEKVHYGDTRTNRFIGYLPDVPEFYGFMTAKEYLRLCGDITGMPSALIQTKSEELLDLVGLADVKKRIGTFSRGMKQRLGIAQALLNEPRLLICDEPTSALDPIGRREILDILLKVKERTTVVFSTHVLTDVEAICDRVGILDGGKIVLTGSVSELKTTYSKHSCTVTFRTPADAAVFQGDPRINLTNTALRAKDPSVTIKADDPEVTMALIIRILGETGLVPLRLETAEPKLEDIFLEVVR
ncbi:ABC transporter ATP-binding protein [Trichococcus shcherbakoviae]|uniref:ABC transporter ATP-binding protein n=1 Tax=Trichococcus shcherbakoviae subsp. psychrophilus TaxID=2585775 RepID=A0A5C5EBL3_9LACT|nr:ABC transporter ATP-binding protein [Trichococcus shcherbakoviae]OUL10071.1 ABC transporter ATP-binding protein [Sedimentibacter sp. SX930]TNV70549.1 ABC transporter ATP-binding protein [Trichococcus shcherbakoviae subsp. psychrophilus]